MTDFKREHLLTILSDRRREYRSSAPRIRWKTWAAVTLALVAWAMLFKDVELVQAARQNSQWFRSLSLFLTDFGNAGWALFLSAGVFGVSIWLSRREDGASPSLEKARYWATAGAFIFLSIALSGILGNLAKRIIGRGRPRVFDDFGAFEFHPLAGSTAFESFPSGHSVTDGAIVMSLAVLFPRFRVPLLIAGFGLAMTRVFVGAHYLSDVIAGYSFGLWYAYMSAIFFAQYGFSLKRT